MEPERGDRRSGARSAQWPVRFIGRSPRCINLLVWPVLEPQSSLRIWFIAPRMLKGDTRWSLRVWVIWVGKRLLSRSSAGMTMSRADWRRQSMRQDNGWSRRIMICFKWRSTFGCPCPSGSDRKLHSSPSQQKMKWRNAPRPLWSWVRPMIICVNTYDRFLGVELSVQTSGEHSSKNSNKVNCCSTVKQKCGDPCLQFVDATIQHTKGTRRWRSQRSLRSGCSVKGSCSCAQWTRTSSWRSTTSSIGINLNAFRERAKPLLSTSSIGEVGRNQGDDGTHSSEGMLRALEACAPREQQGDPLRIVSSRNRGHERRLDGIWKSMMHRVLCKRQCRIDGDPGRHFQEKGFRVDCCHGRFSVREDKS